jgi:hypothetical protein
MPAPRLSCLAALLSGAALVAASCAEEVVTDELPIRDDFSGDCQWAEGDEEGLSFACRDGEYRVLLDGTTRSESQVFYRMLEEAAPSVNVEVDVLVRPSRERQRSDAFEFHGIGCWASVDPELGYLFLVAPSSAVFGIARIDERDPNYMTFLADRPDDAVAEIGDANEIRAECRPVKGGPGVDLTMYLDGKQVWAAVDPEGRTPFEAVGLFARSNMSGTDLRFDNFNTDSGRR